MFTTERVPVSIKKIALDFVERNDETHRLALVTFVVEPLSYDLAREIGEDVAEHLFLVHRKTRTEPETYEARGELADVTFALDSAQLYRMGLAPTDDRTMHDVVTIARAALSKFRAKRDKKAPMWSIEFVVTFVVDDPAALWRVIGQWHSDEKTFATFAEIEDREPLLPFAADAGADEQRVH
jgi:hypothetical protein